MKVLSVYFHGLLAPSPLLIGRLAYHQGLGQFELHREFLSKGVNISPFTLKLHAQLQSGSRTPFNGLHGVFADSLPDGWGHYLMDKLFRQHGIDPSTLTPIDRLAYMGDRAMGALSYILDEGDLSRHIKRKIDDTSIDLDRIATEASELFTGKVDKVLNQLAVNGTPSGGARPKMLVGLRDDHLLGGSEALPEGFEHWLVKFPTGTKPTERSEGAIEYVYSQMARKAGIDFPETKLIPGRSGNAYFLTKRFDRSSGNKRIHTHSLAGLINADFRVPDFDYEMAMKVCSQLTQSHQEREKLLKRMIFNIMAGNRDDHTKNFSFIMTADGTWLNSPAYDVTYNTGINGEHTMSIAGLGKNITREAIGEVAKIGSITPKTVKRMITEISDSLSAWESKARQYNIPSSQIREISNYIDARRRGLAK